MPDGIELRDYACPNCGSRARLDPRFIQWCTDCGHNADPKPPELGKREQRRAEREYERSRRLFESLRTARSLRPTSATGVYVTLLSAVVHLITFAVLVLPVLNVVLNGGGFWPGFIVLLGVLTFLAVRPRLPQRRLDQKVSLNRSLTPKFYELLDRCAAELGCPVPSQVHLDLKFNASTGRAGLSQRSYLKLGVPLWMVLSGEERIALLGHELAHQINGDTTHGLWAASARRSLDAWTKLLDPRETDFERSSKRRTIRLAGRRTGGGIGALLAPVLVALVFAPFFLITLGCRRLLTRLDLYCGQRAEYLADELGARLAGSDAVYGLLAKLALVDSVSGFLTAARSRSRAERERAATGLWARMAEYIDSVPETERQRRKIVDRLHNTRTDRTHPANHLRISLIEVRPQWAGVLKVSEDEWAAIDAELAPGYLGAAKRLLSGA